MTQRVVRIVVIPLRFIGDSVLTIPLLRQLRQQQPEAHISVLVSSVAAPLLQNCPYVDDVLIEPKGFVATVNLLSGTHANQAFILRKSVTMALQCRLAGIAKIVGYDMQRWGFLGFHRSGALLDNTAPYPGPDTIVHQAVHHLGLLEAAGLAPAREDSQLELWAEKTDEHRIQQLLKEKNVPPEKPMAVVHAVSASFGKSVSPTCLVPVVQRLHAAGYAVLATGTATDHSVYEQLGQLAGVPVVNLAGETSLTETVALYRQVKLWVGVDSGPIHLAAAAGVPHIIGLYRHTNPAQWGVQLKNGQQFWPVVLPNEDSQPIMNALEEALPVVNASR